MYESRPLILPFSLRGRLLNRAALRREELADILQKLGLDDVLRRRVHVHAA